MVGDRPQLPAVRSASDLARAEAIRLDDATAKYRAAAKSEGTRRAYTSDLRDFISWCQDNDRHPLPAAPETVSRYLVSLAEAGRSVSTINRRSAAITHAHRLKKLDSPTATEEVRGILAGIRNVHGAAPKKKRALTDDLVAKVLKPLRKGIMDVRDRAMIALCFGAALRRSELVALTVADLEFHPRGLLVTLRKSKTDQGGKGKTKAVPSGKLKIPEAVEAWLKASGITEGYVFRGFDHGIMLSGKMDGGSFARMLKRRVEAVGLDPTQFSGHSARRGFASSADEHGADLKATSEHMGHARIDTTIGYMQSGDLFRKNAGSKFL